MKNQIQTASEVKNSIRARTLAHETRRKSAMSFKFKNKKWQYVQMFIIAASLLYLWIDKLFIYKQASLIFLGILSIVALGSLWQRKYLRYYM